MVFNDLFTTVPSIEREDQPPSHWEDLCLQNTTFIPIDNQSPLPLNSEWRSTADTEQEHRDMQRTNRVHSDTSNNYQTTDFQDQESLFLPNPHSSGVLHTTNTYTSPPLASTEGDLPNASTEGDNSPNTLRRSSRSNKGKFTSTRYINEGFLAAVTPLNDLRDNFTALCYQAELETDMETFESNITDPRVYAAKYTKKQYDPDTPTFHQAMAGDDADKYIEAIKEEITNLQQMKTWDLVDCEPTMKVLKGTSAFRLKRTPDGVLRHLRQ